jgi:hypothetical protein
MKDSYIQFVEATIKIDFPVTHHISFSNKSL